jgi:1,4-dihydroxy-2-naphthoate octaprenyltransferase
MTTPDARPSTATAIWLALRPKTLTAGIAPVLVGTAVAAARGQWRLLPALAALAGATAIQIGTNLFNDYEDFRRGADTHERLGPARATQQGWIGAAQVRAMALGAFAVATAFGLYLTAIGGWPVVAIGLASLLSGWLYTGGPAPLAYVGLGDVFVFVFFGLVAVAGTTYVQTGTLEPQAVLAGAALGALATAILVVNNLRDRGTDAQAGKRTLAVRFGATAARAEYLALVWFAYVVPVLAAALGRPYWLLAWLSLPLAVMETRGVLSTDGAALNPRLGGAAKLGLVYSVLLAVGIVL